jgi:hypothetical protein
LFGQLQLPEAGGSAWLSSVNFLNALVHHHHESIFLMILAISRCSKLASRQATALTSANLQGSELANGTQFSASFILAQCPKGRARSGLNACNDRAPNSNLL